MSTFAYEFLNQLDEQWCEVDLLINEARNAQAQSKEDLYDVLCRSSSLLIVAHLEGFMKGLTKCAIRDLNCQVKFKDMPAAVKRTYCKKFIGFDESVFANYNVIINDMISDLEKSQDIKVCDTPFIFDKNRNPKPDSIKTVFERFGVKDIFKHLHESIFDEAFSARAKLQQLLRIMSWHTRKKLKEYPCETSSIRLKLSPKKYQARTLWSEFLDETNKIRHSIAHGNSFSNDESIESIEERRDKARLFQLAAIYILYDAIKVA
ncbi:HEPN domain-containing protein [Aeromonas sanarellii]|uniref:HEPN domain-containing protein n=1 Tax=Aeromonas sanarellii TaxID=633415 RepID=UPI002DBB2BD4|nr:HEPN domain-containing protein [Aeromonas sanarellii]MEB6608777.1 HEPN domain-containing protein [Aeromonas sanarellii]